MVFFIDQWNISRNQYRLPDQCPFIYLLSLKKLSWDTRWFWTKIPAYFVSWIVLLCVCVSRSTSTWPIISFSELSVLALLFSMFGPLSFYCSFTVLCLSQLLIPVNFTFHKCHLLSVMCLVTMTFVFVD